MKAKQMRIDNKVCLSNWRHVAEELKAEAAECRPRPRADFHVGERATRHSTRHPGLCGYCGSLKPGVHGNRQWRRF